MEKDTVIKVSGVSKKFSRSLKRSMFYGSIDIAKSMAGIRPTTEKLRRGEFWSLQDINFELKKGGALGIIGQNGSGKTTLLRLINGIFPPDKGEIYVNGRIGALIAVGAGFHPHMTGRENIYLNGTILGMTKAEIERKYQDIIDFADIGNFIDSPVSTYSSGMSIRLGFSIAIHSQPEILLADEVLAVGDLAFALKCYKKIAQFRREGGSIILVSHGMQLVRNICDSVLWIDKGVAKEYGNTQMVCDKYEKFMYEKSILESGTISNTVNNDPNFRITKVEFLNKDGQSTKEFDSGEFFRARIHYSFKELLKQPLFSIGIHNTENIIVIGSFSNFSTSKNLDNLTGTGYVDVDIESMLLRPGNYTSTITLCSDTMDNILDWHDKLYDFIIKPDGGHTNGILNIKAKWEAHNE